MLLERGPYTEKVAKPAEEIVVTKLPVDDQCLLVKNLISIWNKS